MEKRYTKQYGKERRLCRRYIGLRFVILLIIEIVTMGLTTIWFAGGASAAMAAGLIGLGTGIQILVFLVVSVLLLVLTRPIAVKYFNQGETEDECGEPDRAAGAGIGRY